MCLRKIRAAGKMCDTNLKFSKYLYPNSIASVVLLASKAIKNSPIRTENERRNALSIEWQFLLCNDSVVDMK